MHARARRPWQLPWGLPFATYSRGPLPRLLPPSETHNIKWGAVSRAPTPLQGPSLRGAAHPISTTLPVSAESTIAVVIRVCFRPSR